MLLFVDVSIYFARDYNFRLSMNSILLTIRRRFSLPS